MRLASLLLLALVATALVACKAQPSTPPATNTAGDATEIEKVFDQGFPQDETTTFSDDFDTLDSDLAMS